MIRKVKGGYVLKAKVAGHVLGKHATKAQAMKRERAIQVHRAMLAGGKR